MGKKNKKKHNSKKQTKQNQESIIEEAKKLYASFEWNINSKNENIMLGAFMIFALIIFLLTMPPAMIGGDSGEFSAIACSGGVPHPPGYPLYAMIAPFFNMIFPFGSPGWRPNFLSSLMALATMWLIFKTVRSKDGSVWGALMASGLFAFSDVIWRYSNTSEVFALNNLFIALLLYVYFTYEEGNRKHAYFGAFIMGLGLTNHHTFAFYGLPIVIAIIYRDYKTYTDLKTWIYLLLFGILGLSPYGYLTIVSMNVPELSWGDQTTIDGFLHHFLRKEFGTFKLNPRTSNSEGIFWSHVFTYLKMMAIDLSIIAVPFLFFAYKKFKHDFRMRVSLIAFVFYFVLFTLMTKMQIKTDLNLEVLSRFWQQVLIPFYIWAGIGLDAGVRNLKLPKNFVPGVAVVSVLASLTYSYNHMDFSKNYIFPIFGKSILKPLEKDSLFLVHRDVAIFSSRYVQSCMDYRKDVNILVREQMKTDWYHRIVENNFPTVSLPSLRLRPQKHPKNFNLKQFFDANIDKNIIYITNFGKLLKDKSWEKDYLLMPWGMVDKVYRKAGFDYDSYIKEALQTLPSFEEVEHLQKYLDHPWEKFTWPIYWNAFYNLVETISIRGQEVQNKEYLAKAIEIYENMERVFLSKPAGFYKVLGVTYQRMQYFDPKYESKKVDAFRKYLQTNPAKDPQAPLMLNIVKQYEARLNKAREDAAKAQQNGQKD